MDELTTTGETEVASGATVEVRACSRSPRRCGPARAPLAELTGGARTSTPPPCRPAGRRDGAYRDIVLLNAAAAFLVGDKVETLAEGVELAADVIDEWPRQGRPRRLVADHQHFRPCPRRK
jgi:anthranilate phosphoribosyltransferase